MDHDIRTPEEALKAIRDLKAAATKQDASLEEVTKRCAELDQAVKVLYERNAAPEPVGGSDRELVARYTDEAGKPMLRGRYDGAVWIPGLLDDKPCTELQADLQRAVDDRSVIVMLLHGIDRHRGMSPRRGATPVLDARIARLARGLPSTLRDGWQRAWGDSAGAGAEFIPDQMLPTYERDIKLEWEHRVPGLFAEIPAETPIKWGLLTGGWQVYLAGDVTGDNPGQIKSSSPATSDKSLDFITFAARCQVGEDAVEDALLPVMDAIIRPGLVLAVAAGEEDAIINGDTAATHQDAIASWNPDSFWPTGATRGGSIDHRRAYIGLRARAADVSNTVDRSTFNVKNWIIDLANLDGPMARPEDTVAIMSKLGFAANCFSDTTQTTTLAVRTLDEYVGRGAPIVPGEIARVGGVPVVLSQFMTSDLKADGLYDGVTTTYTGALQARRNRFKRFVRRGLRVEVDKDITRQVYNLVVTTRRNFTAIGPATEKNVRYLIKMAKS